ncbi:unnamed protein product [Lactuca saligna]|uniref:Endoplasmic reticulum resident protein 29 C-terminal domain-containing protein n=1 Tax=Lactuca saligna TaxID=75948 RepID=A0AA35UZD9_LACSI|nr:unnamed protein product [Lactuca saligna]
MNFDRPLHLFPCSIEASITVRLLFCLQKPADTPLSSTSSGLDFASTMVYESLAAAYKNEKDVVISNLDVDNYKDLSEKYGKIYVKDAKSSLSKGCDYANNEIQHLERILSKSISPTKAYEFTLKKNILSAFA